MIISSTVGTNLGAIARDWAAAPQRWDVAPRFDPLRRWYTRLAGQPDVEVWLLTWLPGQDTDLHDHGGSAGAFHVLSGTLTEQTVDGGSRLTESVRAAGTTREFGPRHIHRIVNAGHRPAISVHAYGPALSRMTRYRLRGGELSVAAVDRAGAQW